MTCQPDEAQRRTVFGAERVSFSQQAYEHERFS
jgi:hypothetical protein